MAQARSNKTPAGKHGGLLGRLLPKKDSGGSRAWSDLLGTIRAEGFAIHGAGAHLDILDTRALTALQSGGSRVVAAAVRLRHAILVLLPVRIDATVVAAPRTGDWETRKGRRAEPLPSPLGLLDTVMGALKEAVPGITIQGTVVLLGEARFVDTPPGRVTWPDEVLPLLRDLGGDGASLPEVTEAWETLAGGHTATEARETSGQTPTPEPEAADARTSMAEPQAPMHPEPPFPKPEPDSDPRTVFAPGTDRESEQETGPNTKQAPEPEPVAVPEAGPAVVPDDRRPTVDPDDASTGGSDPTVKVQETRETTPTAARARPFHDVNALRLEDELASP